MKRQLLRHTDPKRPGLATLWGPQGETPGGQQAEGKRGEK